MNKAVAIAGFSASGKTRLICGLLAWLGAQGLKVGVLKHSHKHSLGDEGKDTGQFRQAGAHLVALAAPGLLQINRRYAQDPPLAEALALLAPEVDLILVEGYKSGPLPKVVVLGPEAKRSLPDYPAIIALVSPEPLASPLPVFQPGQVAELGGFIMQYLGLS